MPCSLSSTTRWRRRGACSTACPRHEFSWKPHDKSMTLGQLAGPSGQHPLLVLGDARRSVLDLDTLPRRRTSEGAGVARRAARGVRPKGRGRTRAARARRPIAELLAPWTLKKGDQEFFTMPRIAAIRSFVMNHSIHHRGQLSVYLRLNDVPIPPIYGPTADEPGIHDGGSTGEYSASLPCAFCRSSSWRTINSAGYRYGASDQAFYAPAILKRIDPSLYPRDSDAHPITGQADARRRRARTAGARHRRAPAGGVRRAARRSLCPCSRVAGVADRRRSLSHRMGGRRADGGTHAAPRDQQVGHEHARRVLSPAATGVRDRRARDRQLPRRPLRASCARSSPSRARCIRRPRSGSPSGWALPPSCAEPRLRRPTAAASLAIAAAVAPGRSSRAARGTARPDGRRLARDAGDRRTICFR